MIPHRSPTEYPSPSKQRAMGELLFLAMRSDRYARIPLHSFKDVLEPAIDHNLLQIFRFEEVPRAAILWARFSPEAEARFLMGETLDHGDWISGDRVWITTLLAPYDGLVPFIYRWFKTGQKTPYRNFHCVRFQKGSSKLKSVVSVDFEAPAGQRIQTRPVTSFLDSARPN